LVKSGVSILSKFNCAIPDTGSSARFETIACTGDDDDDEEEDMNT